MMVKNKRLLFYAGLMLFSLLISAGSVVGAEQPGSQQFSWEKPGYSDAIPGLSKAGMLPNPWMLSSTDPWSEDTEQSRLLAQAEADKKPEAEEDAALSPVCAEYAKDRDADIGELMEAGCKPTTAQMARLMDNPLGNVAMLFTQFDLTLMNNPSNDKYANKGNYMGILQFPKGLGKNWNIINRVVWNVPSMPLDSNKIDQASQYASGEGQIVLPPAGSPTAPIDLFEGRTTGFGDMYYNGLFSPKKGKKLENGGSLLWGAGFDLGFPTASDDLLGTGKWLAGPSALGVYMGPKWKVGALWQQYWSYAGDSDRDDVNLTNLQYFVFYSLSDTLAIGAAPNIIGNWEQNKDNRWTVPIGLGLVNTFQFGKVPVRIGAELHYSIVAPDTTAGAEWNFRFYFIPAAPSFMFSWMQ